MSKYTTLPPPPISRLPISFTIIFTSKIASAANCMHRYQTLVFLLCKKLWCLPPLPQWVKIKILMQVLSEFHKKFLSRTVSLSVNQFYQFKIYQIFFNLKVYTGKTDLYFGIKPSRYCITKPFGQTVCFGMVRTEQM